MFKFKRSLLLFLLSLLIVLIPLHQITLVATASSNTADIKFKPQNLPLIEQGRLLYEAQKYTQAIATLQPAIEEYQAKNDSIRTAMVHNN
ncbi:MAG: hypothetical protein ACFCAD_13200 [Pleurocapsa sp.]